MEVQKELGETARNQGHDERLMEACQKDIEGSLQGIPQIWSHLSIQRIVTEMDCKH